MSGTVSAYLDVENNDHLLKRNPLRLLGAVIVIIAFTAIVLIAWGNSNNGYDSTVLTIEKGASAADVAAVVYEAGLVRSESLFYFTLVIAGDPEKIKAGDYAVESGMTSLDLVKYIMDETPQEPMVAVTLPEGISILEIAAILEQKLSDFDKDEFLALAVEQEGYLWPETYFLPENYTASSTYRILRETAQKKQAEVFSGYNGDLSKEEVVILASIVEREANSAESMRLVAGILLNRLEIDMALQADATIEYALETKIGELPAGQLAAELREFDTPYNSYLYRGLPPTPIGNPGQVALEAVINPTASEYFYYITDDEGNFHYAETYDEHIDNVNLYLR